MGMQGCTPRAGEPDHPLPQWESDQEQFCWRQQGKMGIAGMSEEWDLIFLFWNVLLLQWSNNNIINNCIHFLANFIKRNCIGCLLQGVSSSGATGVVSVRRDGGCPVLHMTGSSWLQQTQLSPSANVVASLGKCLWKDRKCRRGAGKTEKQQREHQVQRRRRGKKCSRLWSRDSSAAHGGRS